MSIQGKWQTPPAYSFLFGFWVIRGGNRFWKKSVVPLKLLLPENLRFFGDSALSEGETAFGKNRLSPSNSSFPKTSDFFGGFGYPREKPLLEKIGCPPRTPPSRKSLLLFSYFIRLFKFILTIKLLIRINIHITHPIQRTRKEKADI